MIVWKVKLSTSRSVDGSKTIRVPFDFLPTRRRALKALAKVEHLPYDRWNLGALFGWLVRHYEARYCRKWPFSGSQNERDMKGLGQLVEAVGYDEAARAIAIVLTPQFKWLHTPVLSLYNRDFYGHYILPALQKVRDSQESQWTGGREGKPRDVSAEFFGG